MRTTRASAARTRRKTVEPSRPQAGARRPVAVRYHALGCEPPCATASISTPARPSRASAARLCSRRCFSRTRRPRPAHAFHLVAYALLEIGKAINVDENFCPSRVSSARTPWYPWTQRLDTKIRSVMAWPLAHSPFSQGAMAPSAFGRKEICRESVASAPNVSEQSMVCPGALHFRTGLRSARPR